MGGGSGFAKSFFAIAYCDILSSLFFFVLDWRLSTQLAHMLSHPDLVHSVRTWKWERAGEA